MNNASRATDLWSALARLDRMLERAIGAADAAYNAGASAEPYRGLYITSDEVQRLLRREPGSLSLAADVEPDAETASRFPWLRQHFGLAAFDVDLVLIALAPEVDLRYERLFAYLHDDVTRRRPTVDLALNLLCSTREAKLQARSRLAPDAPLMRQRILSLVPDGGVASPPLLAHALKLDDSIVRCLLGYDGLDARLVAFTRLETIAPSAVRGDWADLQRMALQARETHEELHVYFEGAGNGVKRDAAAALAAALDAPLLSANMARAVAAADFDTAAQVLFREALLLNAVIYLEQFESLSGHERKAQADLVRELIESAPGVVAIDGYGPIDARFRTVISLPFREPGFHERRRIWADELRQRRLKSEDVTLDELAGRYRLNADQIRRSVLVAAHQATLTNSTPQLPELMASARAQSARDLGTLARKVSPVSEWKDLVLPADQIAQLQEICRHARYAHIVWGDWGFDEKLSLGKGLSALFSGPPGTGKTMAAEVIAKDLRLDLHKIDLSQVVSKYIGETEKNIDKLFSGAREGNAILFFDECDALFGKRTAVQDAHDRYANIEIAYLLQKMDEHEGLTILATNLRQNLDVAFVRRLTFIIEFPFPDEASRLKIWQGIWPGQLPRAKDLDLDFMASQFKLAGGGVKNIAVAAAFLAAAREKREVKTEHLLWAARREIGKAGRTIPRSEFGKYADRVDELVETGEIG